MFLWCRGRPGRQGLKNLACYGKACTVSANPALSNAGCLDPSELAAFNDKVIGVRSRAVDGHERFLISLVEELFLTELHDFSVDEVQKLLVPFLHSRGNRVEVAELSDPDGKAFVHERPGKDFGVVGGKRVTAAV